MRKSYKHASDRKPKAARAKGYTVKKQDGKFWVITPSGKSIVVSHATRREAQRVADIFNHTNRPEHTVKAVSEVNVFMEGGVIHNIQFPADVRVTVYDYDTEGVEAERLSKDRKGDACLITEWAK